MSPEKFAEHTGWEAKPEGMCREELCVPLPTQARTESGDLNLDIVAQRLQMPVLHDEQAGVWAIGPQSGGNALTTSLASDLSLPDADGNVFNLSSLHGRKVLLVAWASW